MKREVAAVRLDDLAAEREPEAAPTVGTLANEAKVLYEPGGGADGNTGDVFTVSAPGEGTLWAVVHDDRGGVSWVTIPVHAK